MQAGIVRSYFLDPFSAHTRKCVRVYAQKHIETHAHPHPHVRTHTHTHAQHFIPSTRAHLSFECMRMPA